MPTNRSSARRQGEPLSDIARRRMDRRIASGRKSDERWQRILEGASKVFRQRGYAQSTLEDVAAEVGVNRATLYYYVGTKEELLVSLLYRPLHQMAANAKAVASLDLPPTERLRLILQRYVSDMTETPELLIFMAENVHRVLTGAEAVDIADNADAYAKTLISVVEDGIRAGEFRSDIDPHLCMEFIVGAFNWIHRWYRPTGPLSLDQIGGPFIDLALSSLRPTTP